HVHGARRVLLRQVGLDAARGDLFAQVIGAEAGRWNLGKIQQLDEAVGRQRRIADDSSIDVAVAGNLAALEVDLDDALTLEIGAMRRRVLVEAGAKGDDAVGLADRLGADIGRKRAKYAEIEWLAAEQAACL